MEITEQEFTANHRAKLQELSADLRASGLSMLAVSRLTNLSYDVVSAAFNGRSVRYDSYERLRLVLRRWKEERPQYTTGTYTITARPGIPTGVPKPEPAPEQPKPATPPRGKGGKFVKKTINPEKK